MSDSGAEGQPDSSEEEESQTFVADVVHFGKSYKGLTGLFSACLGVFPVGDDLVRFVRGLSGVLVDIAKSSSTRGRGNL